MPHVLSTEKAMAAVLKLLLDLLLIVRLLAGIYIPHTKDQSSSNDRPHLRGATQPWTHGRATCLSFAPAAASPFCAACLASSGPPSTSSADSYSVFATDGFPS